MKLPYQIRKINFKSLIVSIFFALGTLYSVVEATSFFAGENFVMQIKSIWWFFLLIGVVVGVFRSLPKTNFSAKIKNKDVHIYIKVTDAFSLEGALIIPINNEFDTELKGNVQRAKSMKNKLIVKHFDNNPSYLKQVVDSTLNESKFKSKKIPGTNKYEMGTVVPIRKDKKCFYLLVNSEKTEHDRVRSVKENLTSILSELWTSLSYDSDRENIVIPVLGTGNGRINMQRQDVVKEIILSFIVALKENIFCDSLTIAIRPEDLELGGLDLNELSEFLTLQCKYAEFYTKDTSKTGTPI